MGPHGLAESAQDSGDKWATRIRDITPAGALPFGGGPSIIKMVSTAVWSLEGEV